MDDTTATTVLTELLWEALDDGRAPELAWLESFADAGVMTTNEGLVLRMADGTEFQVTVVRSR